MVSGVYSASILCPASFTQIINFTWSGCDESIECLHHTWYCIVQWITKTEAEGHLTNSSSSCCNADSKTPRSLMLRQNSVSSKGYLSKGPLPCQEANQTYSKDNHPEKRTKAQTIALGAFMILCLSRVLSLCLKAPKAVNRTIRNATLPQTFQK